MFLCFYSQHVFNFFTICLLLTSTSELLFWSFCFVTMTIKIVGNMHTMHKQKQIFHKIILFVLGYSMNQIFPTFSISFHSKDCVVNDLLNSMAFLSQIRSHVSGKPWYLTKSCCSHLASSSISVIEYFILKQQEKKENRERERKKLSVNLCQVRD